MSATRFVRRPDLDIPTCAGCGDMGFDTKAYVDQMNGQLLRVVDEAQLALFDEPTPEEQLPLALDCDPPVIGTYRPFAD